MYFISSFNIRIFIMLYVIHPNYDIHVQKKQNQFDIVLILALDLA